MQFCCVWVFDHTVLQPRRLLEACGAGMNSENECKADPGQTSDVDSTQKTLFTRLRFSSMVPRMYTLLSIVLHDSSYFLGLPTIVL